MNVMRIGLALTSLIMIDCGQPKAGDSCQGNAARCANLAIELACENGTWRSFACPGPGGCALQGGVVACDLVGSTAGAPCPSGLEGTGVCVGTSAQLVCRKGKLEPVQCPLGCQRDPKGTVCKQQIQEGDPCFTDSMCSPNKKAVWVCAAGHWKVEQRCAGPKGCFESGLGPACDVTGDEKTRDALPVQPGK